MKAYLTTMLFIFLLNAGISVATKPGDPRKPSTSGTLFAAFIVEIAFAAWTLVLLLKVEA